MIKWNPYPQTKPPKDGRYLISVQEIEGNESFVQIEDFFIDSESDNEWFDVVEKYITAWAELPKTYKKPIQIKAYPILSHPKDKRILLIDKKTLDWRVTHAKASDFDTTGFTHWADFPEFQFVDESPE